MTLEPINEEMGNGEELLSPPEPVSSNRTFLIVAGILGGIMLMALLALAAYAIFFAPQRRSLMATQVASRNSQNTQVALAGEQTIIVVEGVGIVETATEVPGATATQTREVRATSTHASTASPAQEAAESSTPEPTLVIAAQVTQDSAATEDPRTATVAALLTQAAGADTPEPLTATVSALLTQTAGAVTPDIQTATSTALITATATAGGSTLDPRTATVAALFTQAASTGIPRTATVTALPATGFADEAGVPGLLGLALVLIVVIFLARRLRTVF
jgi:LPXTG-motif cell wall-anchored protein